MSATQRGCLIFLAILGVLFVGVFLIPIVFLAGSGQATTLPVITMPAEYYRKDWPSPSFELVNSLGGALVANIILLIVIWRVWGASKGWTNKIPGRLQAAIEMIVDLWWGLTKQQAGNSPKSRRLLMPLVASIFMFLLAANLGKLIPGFETVGVLHCAVSEPVTFNGHPVTQYRFLGRDYFTYRIDGPLQTGTPATYDSYHQCEAMLGEHKYIKDGYLPDGLDPFFDAQVTVDVSEGMTLNDVLAEAESQLAAAVAVGLPASENRRETMAELTLGEYDAVAMHYNDPYAIYDSFTDVEFSIGQIAALNADANGVVNIEFDHDAEGGEGTASFDFEGQTYTLPHGYTADTPLLGDQTVVVRPELIGEHATTRENQLYTVAPFARGVSTDLSFTIGLAIMSFFFIQYFGLSTLGPDYLQKFVNLRALGNAGKNPIGGVDFIVGLFEIVSEFGKIISLAFRLFGALFAGSVLFVVFLFLTGTVVPLIILLLELIVGTAQAAVFAVLTLIFCAQAMVSHHHDDDHDDHHGDGH